MPKIYVSTACLPMTAPLQTRLDVYRAAGLTRVELGAGVTVEGFNPHHVTGFQVLLHNYFPPPEKPFVLNLASADEGIREQSLQLVLNGLRHSSALGAFAFSVHAGFVHDPIGFGQHSFLFPAERHPEDSDRAFDRFVQTLLPALELAERLNLKLLLENNICPPDLRHKLLLQTPEEFQQLVQRVAHPSIGILLDTGHLNVSAKTFGFDPGLFFRQLQPYIHLIHLHINDGSADLHQPVWEHNWALDAAQKTEHVVIEAKFETPEALVFYHNWLKTALYASA